MSNIHQALNEALHAISDIADGISQECAEKFAIDATTIATLRTDAQELLATIDRYERLLTATVPA